MKVYDENMYILSSFVVGVLWCCWCGGMKVCVKNPFPLPVILTYASIPASKLFQYQLACPCQKSCINQKVATIKKLHQICLMLCCKISGCCVVGKLI